MNLQNNKKYLNNNKKNFKKNLKRKKGLKN